MKTFCLALLAACSLTAITAAAGPTLYIDDANGLLGTVDVQTGASTVIGATGVALTDIAFAPNGTLYGLSFTQLYRLDPKTAAATLIGPHGIPGGNALVFGSDGTLYAAGSDTTGLYLIDVSTGSSKLIADIGANSAGDLAFHDGQLYLSSTTNELIRIDPATFTASAMGDFGFDDVYGLATGSNDVLYGVTGTQIFSVDPSTGAGALLVDYSGQGLAAAHGTSFVTEAIPVITSALIQSAQVAEPFNYQITSINAPAAYTASNLPPGLSLNAETGLISGVPTQVGTTNTTLAATNSGGGVGFATLTFTVVPAGVPVITSPAMDDAQVGEFFRYQITATNLPTSFTAVDIPAGLTFYPASGVLAGVPDAAGSYTVTFNASNSGGTTMGAVTITVAPPALPVITLAADVARVTAGTGMSGEFVLVRSGADSSANLRVNYTVKGSATGGTDYTSLKGFKRMKPGKTNVKIPVVPIGNGAGPGVKRVVTIALALGDGYTVGKDAQAKVKIFGQ